MLTMVTSTLEFRNNSEDSEYNEYFGKGYSSSVHKGLHDKNGEEVSIKVIEMAKLEDPINQMLLQLEVSALKALSMSKHVLHLFDVYATRNNTYLITELC